MGLYVKPQPKAYPTNIANKTSPQGTTTKRQNWNRTRSAGVGGSGLALAILVGSSWVGLGWWFDHAVSWEGRSGVALAILVGLGRVGLGLWFDVKTHGL